MFKIIGIVGLALSLIGSPAPAPKSSVIVIGEDSNAIIYAIEYQPSEGKPLSCIAIQGKVANWRTQSDAALTAGISCAR